MSGFETNGSPVAEQAWAARSRVAARNRPFDHSHLRAIAIGIVSGLAIGLAATAESGNAGNEELIEAGVTVTIDRPPPAATDEAMRGAEANRDSAHIMRVKARGAIFRGSLAEAERYLQEADELDPEAPMLPELRRLIDLSKSRLEMG